MRASLDGGSLGRWFEQLCRIRHPQIHEMTVRNGTRLRNDNGRLPDCGAIYIFWWTGSGKLLRSRSCRRDLILKSPGGKDVLIHINDDWLGLRTDLPIPLYIGKTAAGLRNRINQHLLLARQRILPRDAIQRRSNRQHQRVDCERASTTFSLMSETRGRSSCKT